MEKERQLEAQLPRREPLVDPYLIAEYYGSASNRKKKASLSNPLDELGDIKEMSPLDEPWADSDREDEDPEVRVHVHVHCNCNQVTTCTMYVTVTLLCMLYVGFCDT